MRADAGVSLDALIRALLPFGWFVHVTPGTRQVTLGGALAADVHGKSHHFDGSFANHVVSFTLHTPTGTVEVTPESDPELFWGTAGGMGLTGVIGQVTMRLLPVRTSMIRAENIRFPDLDSVMAAMTEDDADIRYSAAWIDCLAQGASLGRSILSRGDHAELDDLPAKLRRDPFRFGGHRASSSRRRGRPTVCSTARASPRSTSCGSACRPRCTAATASRRSRRSSTRSTACATWNRLYGSRGFLQYQYVVPDSRARGGAHVDRDAERGARRVVPRGAQALRPGQPRSAVVPAARLDARARHPRDRARASTRCSTVSTSSSPRPAGASTSPRTRACAPSWCR